MLRLCLLLLLPLSPFSYMSAQSAASVARLRLAELGNDECRGNSITLLKSPQAKYDTLFNSIREAERYVHLEYYWLGNDSVGGVLTGLLAERARQGVEVRLLIDDYANRKSDSRWSTHQLDSLNALGIRVAMFDPFRFPRFKHSYHRDHRKIAVVDGKRVFSGGMNIADYYLTGTERSGPWRDMHFCIDGPAVDAYERAFERIWEKETGEMLDTVKYVGLSVLCGGETVSVVNREPHHLSRRMREAYTASMDAARQEIRIVNPYPTNVRMVRKAMRRALKRGVRVMVMVSATSDVRVTPDVIGVEMRKLTRRGCEVYYYEGGFHHGKVMTVDGEFCTVGTANLDGRSLLFDYEINAFVFDRETTRELNSVFDDDLTDSELLTPEAFKRRFPLRHRMVGRILGVVKGLF